MIVIPLIIVVVLLVWYAYLCESVYDPISIPETDLERRTVKLKEEIKLCSMRLLSK